jgi:hypothetical protein
VVGAWAGRWQDDALFAPLPRFLPAELACRAGGALPADPADPPAAAARAAGEAALAAGRAAGEPPRPLLDRLPELAPSRGAPQIGDTNEAASRRDARPVGPSERGEQGAEGARVVGFLAPLGPGAGWGAYRARPEPWDAVARDLAKDAGSGGGWGEPLVFPYPLADVDRALREAARRAASDTGGFDAAAAAATPTAGAARLAARDRAFRLLACELAAAVAAERDPARRARLAAALAAGGPSAAGALGAARDADPAAADELAAAAPRARDAAALAAALAAGAFRFDSATLAAVQAGAATQAAVQAGDAAQAGEAARLGGGPAGEAAVRAALAPHVNTRPARDDPAARTPGRGEGAGPGGFRPQAFAACSGDWPGLAGARPQCRAGRLAVDPGDLERAVPLLARALAAGALGPAGGLFDERGPIALGPGERVVPAADLI